MASCNIGLLSIVGAGTQTGLAVYLTESRNKNLFISFGPFFELVTESCFAPYLRCPWLSYWKALAYSVPCPNGRGTRVCLWVCYLLGCDSQTDIVL